MKLPDKIKIAFFKQLALLLEAGLPLLSSLRLLAKTQKSAALTDNLSKLQLALESGHSFYASLQTCPQLASPFGLQLIKLGESSGKLPLMLERIAAFTEQQYLQRTQLRQALFYPALIMLTALTLILVMLFWIVPHFELLFAAFRGKVPKLTQLLFDLSHLVHQPRFWLSLLVLNALAVFLLKRQRVQLKFFLISHLRPLRACFLKFSLFQFTRNLATLLSAGLPLSTALNEVTQLCTYPPFVDAINATLIEIHNGQRFSQALSDQPIFPTLLIEFIRTGEEAGKLDTMLEKFADMVELELNALLASVQELVPPLIITMLGVLIGGLVVAMYLPIFHLGTVI
jgi:type IV pilus assembly protein PilC